MTQTGVDHDNGAKPADPGWTGESFVGDYVSLLKPRVMSLVVFTGLTGMVVAPGTIHWVLGLVAVICISIGAGASGAINMWYDADIDATMDRTSGRPIPSGRVPRADALGFGVALSLASIALMGVAVNWLSAALLAVTIGFYIFVYTMWLKRRTPQNIVIGGAAGAMPPVIGWAATTGDVGLGAIVLFALIFLWTPPHFWALALLRSGEYAAAKVPMLPVVAGERTTKNHILAYSVLVAVAGVAPWYIGLAGLTYGITSAVLGLVFLGFAVAVWRGEGTAWAGRMYGFSILYLFLIFALLLVDGGLAANFGGAGL
ncbi:MAG: protoheme IX farnesyltransferase [Alphaproteobacteria bacterium]|jgi:heme o synthase|nr:protoheme IX farnesyltransferase [Alphaproteobacteria bacterium]MBT5860140.1 protoheme IX farnesyltransferase [Alphaproteobacteria bacterium]